MVMPSWDAQEMPGARWFPDARLNFAENPLRRRDDAVAVYFVATAGPPATFAEPMRVAELAKALQGCGLRPGDVQPGSCRTYLKP